MTFADKRADASLIDLTGRSPKELEQHDSTMLHRMKFWKIKKWWPQSFGPRPGERGCAVPIETQRLFEPEYDGPRVVE